MEIPYTYRFPLIHLSGGTEENTQHKGLNERPALPAEFPALLPLPPLAQDLAPGDTRCRAGGPAGGRSWGRGPGVWGRTQSTRARCWLHSNTWHGRHEARNPPRNRAHRDQSPPWDPSPGPGPTAGCGCAVVTPWSPHGCAVVTLWSPRGHPVVTSSLHGGGRGFP